MGMITKFFALDSRQQLLILRAWAWVCVARMALSLTPLGWLTRQVNTRRLGSRARAAPFECALAVSRASRLVPGATCLVRALAAQWMIRGAGYEPELHFGVSNGEQGFKAHAWLSCEAEVLIGGETKDEYHPFERS